MPNVKLILGDKENKKIDDFLVSKTKNVEKPSKKTASKKDDADKKIAFYFISGVGVATALSAFIVFGALMGLKNDTKLEVPKTGVVGGMNEAEESQEESEDVESVAKEDTEAKKDTAEKEDSSEVAGENSEFGAADSNANNATKNASSNVGNNIVGKNASSAVAKKVNNKNSGSKPIVGVVKPSINNPQVNSLNNAKTTDSNKTFEKTAKEKCEEQAGPREYLGYEVLTTEEKRTKTSKITYYRYVPANGSRFKMVYRNNNCVIDLSGKKKAGEISIEEYIEALDKFVW